MSEYTSYGLFAAPVVAALLVIFWIFKSLHNIPENQVGMVTKKFGKPLPDNTLIARNGEAGYQLNLLMPGWRVKLWPIFTVEKFNRVEIKPNEIGVVIAQVGAQMPIGNKTAVYNSALGDFTDVGAFLDNGGQRGPQRTVLSPGVYVLHPAAFLVVTTGNRITGKKLSEDVMSITTQLSDDKLKMVQVGPSGGVDRFGIVTALDGPPSDGSVANRLGGFSDIEALEAADGGAKPAAVIDLLFHPRNTGHENYQDFQKFLDDGGKIGVQHDPLMPGTYALNPLCVSVELAPMIVVDQGEVAVIKAYVGLPTIDTSGVDYKYGSIVDPGHTGLWSEPLRTGKYPLNPRVYEAEIVPTSILTLNWAKASSEAHDLDKALSSIAAKSKDAFDFSIDLQVQIHVPDTQAPRVIGSVQTMLNLVNEVLQSAVGNYFRNKIQETSATSFITERTTIQQEATTYVTQYLLNYGVEVRGVYIQDVVFPEELTKVLKEREIATQQQETYHTQQAAQAARIDLERQRGVADMQVEKARAEVSIEINRSNAQAAIETANGQATVTKTIAGANAEQIIKIGEAEGAAIEAKGLATAKSYEAQQAAIGREQTAAVALAHEIGINGINITPQIIVGESGIGGLGGLLSAAVAKRLGGDVVIDEARVGDVASKVDGSAADIEEGSPTTDDDSSINSK